MKRIFCLVLTLCLIFCVCGCTDGKEHDSSKESNVDKYASQGVIPEFQVRLGTSVDSFREIYPPDYEDADPATVLLTEAEGQTAVCFTTLYANFYYEKEKIDNGISVLAVMGDTAYGLELGGTVTKSDIEAAVAAPLTESVADADRLYFFPGYVESAKVLTATFENYRLDFFLLEDFLAAVTLTDTANWTD